MSKQEMPLSGVKVLLLEGFARQSMAMMESLHRLGCHVTTYNSSRLDVGCLSRYPDSKIVGFWDRDDEEKSAEALMKTVRENRFDVVIPTTDFSAILLARRKAEFEKYAHVAVNDWPLFAQAADKLNTMIACMDHDVPCPNTLRNADSVEAILRSGMPYPFIIKPRIGYGSIGFHCIRNEADLRKHFDETVSRCGPVVAQDYIPQTDVQYQCEVFMGADGEAKSAHVMSKVRWYPVDGGSNCCGLSIDRPDIAENSVKLLKAMGWRGYADVDLIQDPRDGIPKIMEINPRITAGVKLSVYSGVDFARQIVEDALGMPVTEYKTYRTDVRARYMHTDLLWFLQSKQRFRTQPSWFSWKNTTDLIWNPRDPLPWFGYTLQAFSKYGREMKKRKR